VNVTEKPDIQGPAIGEAGPFQVIDNDGHITAESPIDPPRRRYSCPNYTTCLSIGCALNWDSFTCRGCNGQVDGQVFWRAHQALKRDRVATQLCDLPEIPQHGTTQEEHAGAEIIPIQRVAGKR